MGEEMEDVCEKACVFEESLEIDFDYEFDVAKFYDFTREETPEEVAESQRWFYCALGHPPSPLIAKLYLGADGSEYSETSSSKCGCQTSYSINNDSCGASEVSSPYQGGKGQPTLKCRSKSSSLPRSSRLLKPTASLLAKQNQQMSARSTRIPGRLQKLGSPIKTPGEITATKRQKLEIGYLRKVAHLRHQTSFSHKSPQKVGVTDVKSCLRPKVTIPKEPNLVTARRAERHRAKNAGQLDNNLETNSCPSSASMTEKSVSVYKFKARLINKKIFSSKGDIGVFRNSKRETTIPKEFKLSSSKKQAPNPPVELFSKLSLNSESNLGLLAEEKQPIQNQIKKGLRNNVQSSIMKENKVPNDATGKSSRSCVKQSQFRGGKTITEIGNQLATSRSFLIH